MLRRLPLRAEWMVLCALLVAVSWLLPAAPVHGQDAGLRTHAAGIVERIEASPLGEPILVESLEGERELYGEIHALVPHDFAKVSGTFGTAANWCEIMFLHLNVKACVAGGADAGQTLQMYLGRKHFQTPADATLVALQFRVVDAGADHFAAELSGERGPHGTGNFRMELEALPIDADRTLLRFRYALELGAVTRAAMGVYLSTAGRHRVGFSTGDDGQARVRGLRGMIERNAMRFYLGVRTCLDTLDLPADGRLEARLEHWFDLTERYPEQLRELDRHTYLDQKRREWAEQRRL